MSLPPPAPLAVESPAEDAPVKRKAGRPPKNKKNPDLTLSFDGAASSSASTSAPPTPVAAPVEDPLSAQEFSMFGVAGTEDVLPLPPTEGGSGGPGGAGGGAKRSIDAVGPSAPLGSRAKRPKNVKFSPAKGGKALARRSMATATGHPTTSMDGDPSLPNNDFCDACNGKGHFLCCDGGCLRSFHFSCLEPPLELDDVPDENWYCKACRAAKVIPPKPPRGYFRELIHRIDCENPKAFTLTAEIKSFYKNVATGAAGEFIDTTEHRPPSKITGRAIGQEDRDGYRLRDKFGKTMLCYQCNESASVQKQRRIISCDFCEQHWHLDCLDPPMSGMPPPTRKWMCPVHASDHILPKHRQPKATSTITVKEPAVPNNGDIIIVPQREPPRVMDDYEELTVNRVRYQVPEETVILDFWGRVHEGPKMRGLRSPQRKQVFEKLATSRRRGSREMSVDSAGGSPLTSLGDLSDADPPEVAVLGYSPYSKRTTRPVLVPEPKAPSRPDTTMLDSLAMLAEGYFEHFISTEAAGPSHSSGPKTNLAVKIPSSQNGNGAAGPQSAHGADQSSVGAPPALPHRRSNIGSANSGAPGGSVRSSDKGKGRAIDEDAQGARPSPVNRPSIWGGPQQSVSPAPRDSSTTPPTPALPTELEVNSRDDLKALMAVRKLMGRGDTGVNKTAVLSFIEGAAIVPKLVFMDPQAALQPWELPWEPAAAEKNAALKAMDAKIKPTKDALAKSKAAPVPRPWDRGASPPTAEKLAAFKAADAALQPRKLPKEKAPALDPKVVIPPSQPLETPQQKAEKAAALARTKAAAAIASGSVGLGAKK